jgi:hypothetical protein
MSQTDDRRLLRYAIANIGRDVPESAPHRWRLNNLIKWMTTSTSALAEGLESPDRSEQLATIERLLDQQNVLNPHDKVRLSESLVGMLEAGDPQLALAAHRLMALMTPSTLSPPTERLVDQDPLGAAEKWRDHWRRVDETLALEKAGYDALAHGLGSPDMIERQAAALAIAARGSKLSDGQKLLLARQLIQMLADEDQESQQTAQGALSALATLEDNSRGAWTRERWRHYWDRYERTKLLVPRASAYLSMARTLESKGEHGEATLRYRKIIAEFPNTAPAAEAQQRLAELTSKP